MIVISAVFEVIFALITIWAIKRHKRGRLGNSATVLVLGDVGRSPRMQYHSLCLSKHLDHVDLVGSEGSPPLSSVSTNPKISLILMKPFPQLSQNMKLRKLVFLFYAPIKVISQTLALLWALLYRSQPPKYVLVQNPPSLPSLIVAWIAAKMSGAKFIVDWHNLGYSLLSLSLGGNRHPLVRIAENIEWLFGAKFANSHICVTSAMKHFLHGNWGKVNQRTKIAVLRDQPHNAFTPLSANEKKSFLSKFLIDYLHKNQTMKTNPIINSAINGDVNDIGLIVSSTSWTPDEDFSVLLDSLSFYDSNAPISAKKLLVLITGKGPQRDLYEKKIVELNMKRVAIITAWLSNEDYPKALGSVEIGVSLHQSSSKLDLPMKVLDMFGCGLPVLARSYPCLKEELVDENVTGRTFENVKELYHLFFELFALGISGQEKLETMKKGVIRRNQQQGTWESEWEMNGLPLFTPNLYQQQH